MNIDFDKISPEELDNAIKAIGKDWMLICVKDEKNKRLNAMTASWGALGVLWNKSVAICFVRPQRYTHELLANTDELTLAFLPESERNTLSFCGRVSGRDCDKLGECGIGTALVGEGAAPDCAEVVLVCKKLYEDELREDSFLDKSLLANYKERDYHTFYVCEIKEAYRRKK